VASRARDAVGLSGPDGDGPRAPCNAYVGGKTGLGPFPRHRRGNPSWASPRGSAIPTVDETTPRGLALVASRERDEVGLSGPDGDGPRASCNAYAGGKRASGPSLAIAAKPLVG